MKYISVLLQHHAGPTGDVLIGKNQNGKWEFPHSTVRTNETEAEAVERFVWEQLGLKCVCGKCTMIGHKMPKDGWVEHIVEGNITHNTYNKDVWHLYYEAVNKWQAEPRAIEPKFDVYTEFKYVHATELGEMIDEFEGDDVNFLKKYHLWINAANEIPDVRMP